MTSGRRPTVPPRGRVTLARAAEVHRRVAIGTAPGVLPAHVELVAPGEYRVVGVARSGDPYVPTALAMTRKTALLEAERRWGSFPRRPRKGDRYGFIRANRKGRHRFQVGMQEIGGYSSLMGAGDSWEAAFTEAAQRPSGVPGQGPAPTVPQGSKGR